MRSSSEFLAIKGIQHLRCKAEITKVREFREKRLAGGIPRPGAFLGEIWPALAEGDGPVLVESC